MTTSISLRDERSFFCAPQLSSSGSGAHAHAQSRKRSFFAGFTTRSHAASGDAPSPHYPTNGLVSPSWSSESSPQSKSMSCLNKLHFVCPRPQRTSSKFCRPSCGTPPLKRGVLISDEDEEREDEDATDEDTDYEEKDGYEEDSEEEDEDALDLTRPAYRGFSGTSRQSQVEWTRESSKKDDEGVFQFLE